MRPSQTPNRLVTLAALASLTVLGCKPAESTDDPGTGTGGKTTSGSGGRGGGSSQSGGSGGGSSTGGAPGSGGGGGGSAASGGGSGTSTGGTTGGSASGGTTGSGGSPATGGSSGDAAPTETGTSDTGGMTPAAGWAGVPGIEDLSTVKKSPGCGKAAAQPLDQWVRQNVTVTPKPDKGTGMRNYYLKLPANYDKEKAYRLIFVVPGCNGMGNNLWDYSKHAGAEGVIQIGLNPDPAASSSPGCFDDFRGNSVEIPYVETLLKVTRENVCFDEHRVFFSGHSSGSFVSNMMGCVLGSTKVRAIAPASGGLADATENPSSTPSWCKEFPTPGIWSHNEDEVLGSGNIIAWTKKAINRALKVNKCQGTVDTSPRAPYPGHPNCEKFTTCPPEFPIIFCHPKTGGHEGNKELVPPRAWDFFKSF